MRRSLTTDLKIPVLPISLHFEHCVYRSRMRGVVRAKQMTAQLQWAAVCLCRFATFSLRKLSRSNSEMRILPRYTQCSKWSEIGSNVRPVKAYLPVRMRQSVPKSWFRKTASKLSYSTFAIGLFHLIRIHPYGGNKLCLEGVFVLNSMGVISSWMGKGRQDHVLSVAGLWVR